MTKKALYESIMKSVAKEVKKTLNEFAMTNYYGRDEEYQKRKHVIVDEASEAAVECIKNGELTRGLISKALISDNARNAVAEILADKLIENGSYEEDERENVELMIKNSIDRIAVGGAIKKVIR